MSNYLSNMIIPPKTCILAQPIRQYLLIYWKLLPSQRLDRNLRDETTRRASIARLDLPKLTRALSEFLPSTCAQLLFGLFILALIQPRLICSPFTYHNLQLVIDHGRSCRSRSTYHFFNCIARDDGPAPPAILRNCRWISKVPALGHGSVGREDEIALAMERV